MRLNNWSMPFEKNAISTAVCVGLLALTPAVQAVTLNTTSLVTLPSSVSDADTSTTYAESHADDYTNTGSASTTAKGDDAGWMYTNTSGGGTFSAESTIQQSYSIVNNGAGSQNYFFDFVINFGSLEAYSYTPLLTNEYVTAGNSVSIKLNGAEIFNSDAELTQDVNGYGLVTDGAVLGAYDSLSSPDYYYWSEQDNTLDLGVFGSGESFTLTYDITTFASSNVVYNTPNCEVSDGYGDGLSDGYGSCEEIGGSYAYSQFGDPSGFNSVPTNTITSTLTSVPAPGALFLLGGGLAGMAYTRRRKQRNA